MRINKKWGFTLLALFSMVIGANAVLANQQAIHEEPKQIQNAYSFDNYYSDAIGKTGSNLKSALNGIISKKSTGSYGGLLTTYKTTDVDSDGYIVDMYSNVTKYSTSDNGSSASSEGQGWNREHCIPKSWWGGSTSNQGADPFIVYPTDIYINNMRSAYAYGETKNPTKTSKNEFSKLGPSSISGYSKTVFEPNDMYKGDCARIIFYASTCYSGSSSWTSNDGGSTFGSYNNGLTKYATDLFLKWHEQDPVSDWERTRNERVYGIQNNRNPFIDNPTWANDIWGSSSLTQTEQPTSITLTAPKTKLAVNETTQLSISLTPTNAISTVTYSSSNSTVATVSSSGLVTAKKAGTAEISVVSTVNSSVKDSVTINVVDVDSISISGTPNKTTYEEGDKFDPTGLKVTAKYTDSSTATIANSSCQWLDGNTSSITLKKGTTSVTCKYGGKTATYSPIVVNEKTTITVEAKDIVFTDSGSDSGTLITNTSELKSYVKSGADLIGSVTSAERVYPGKTGIKFGSGSGTGSLSFDLSGKITDVESITVNAAKYKESETCSFKLNGTGITPSSASFADYSVSVSSDLLTIKIEGTSKRFYIKSISINIKESVTPPPSTDDPTTTVPPSTEEPVSNLDFLFYEGKLKKNVYEEGEIFNPEGLSFFIRYKDGDEKEVTNEITFDSNPLSLGQKIVIVTYEENGFEITCEVGGFTVKEAVDDPTTIVPPTSEDDPTTTVPPTSEEDPTTNPSITEPTTSEDNPSSEGSTSNGSGPVDHIDPNVLITTIVISAAGVLGIAGFGIWFHFKGKKK